MFKLGHVLNLCESEPFFKNLSSVMMAELEAKEPLTLKASYLAETVHMGLVPVYVYDEVMADSRFLSFAPRGLGREQKWNWCQSTFMTRLWRILV